MTSPISLSDYKICQVQLTAFVPTSKPPLPKSMAQQTFGNALSECDSVKHFAEKIYRLHETHIPGRARPEEYWVHDVSVIKQCFHVQHEALVFEIRHTPLVAGEHEVPFFLLVDRTIFGSSLSPGRRSDDQVIYSPTRLEPPCSTSIWQLRSTDQGSNLAINTVQLAVLLKSVVDHAPLYNAFKHNCFWFTYVTTRLISILFNHNEPNVVDQQDHKCPCFRRGKFFLFRIGAATQEDITGIEQRYHQYFNNVCYCLKRVSTALIFCLASTGSLVSSCRIVHPYTILRL